jgi:hypothetical protein
MRGPVKTDDLIAHLAADLRVRPVPPWAPALAPFVGLVLTGAPILAALGVRANLGTALADPATAMKWALPLTVAAVALPLAWRRSRPEARLESWPLLLVPVVLTAMVLALSTLAALPPEAWMSAFRGSTRFVCLTSVVGMGLGPLAAALWALGRGATTAPRVSGFLAGLGSGGLAAGLYAVHCTEDAAPFFVTWYGTGILLVGALGALLRASGAALVRLALAWALLRAAAAAEPTPSLPPPSPS